MRLPGRNLAATLSALALLSAAGAAEPPRTDLLGDPLPPRAVARLGTVRLRHGSYVSSLAFAPDGKTLASGGQDGAVRIWDVATGQERLTIAAHPDGIYRVAYFPDGKALASKGRDAEVRFWDAATGKELRPLPGHEEDVWRVAFSPDGKLLVTSDRSGKVRLWDAAGKRRSAFGGSNGDIGPGDSLPDGKTAGSTRLNDLGVLVWDVPVDKEALTLPLWNVASKSAVFSPDGKAVVTWGRAIHLWDAATGKELHQFRADDGGIAAAAFSPDGKALAAAGYVQNSRIRCWDPATGKERFTLPGHDGGVQALAFSPDGRTLASGGLDNVVRLWDLATGKERPIQGHEGRIDAVAFAPDGKALASGGDKTVRLWDPATGKELRRLQHKSFALSIAFSPDGKTLASGGGNPHGEVRDKTVLLWDVASGKALLELRARKNMGNIPSVAFSPDGRSLAAASYWDGTVAVWDVASGKERFLLPEHTNGARAVAFSPDGKVLASGGSSHLRLWDAATGKEWPGPGDRAGGSFAVAFSPDGRTLAASADKTVILSELATGKEVLRLEGHTNAVWTVAFAPDGRTLASGGWDGTVRLWDVATGKERLTLTGHRGTVTSVAFSPGGRTLASGSWDTTALVWDMTGLPAGGRKAERLSGEELESLWNDLGSDDAPKAHRAVWALAAAAGQGLPLLRERMQRLPLPSEKQIERWIADLDSDAFAVREKATRELEDLARTAEPALRRVLAGKPSLEVRRRVEALLEKCEGKAVSPHQLRGTRALQVLEQVGTAEARRLLEALAGGEPAAWLTREAKAALQRLAARPAAAP